MYRFLCSGRTVYREFMDEQERVCLGRTDSFLVPDKN